MKSVRQLLRQPLKTAVGMALMTLAATILCLCVGQALAAKTTKAALDERFSTVGIPLVQEGVKGEVDDASFLLSRELQAWIEKMAVEQPDIVRGLVKHGILSAYVPEVIPYNPALAQNKPTQLVPEQQLYSGYKQASLKPYSCAMLVIRLEEVSEPWGVIKPFQYEPFRLTEKDFPNYTAYFEYKKTWVNWFASNGYALSLKGTVTQVVGLQEGYLNPVGRSAKLTLRMPTLEALEALELEVGQEYIVYGADYADLHSELIEKLKTNEDFVRESWENYDPELLHIYTKEELHESYGVYYAKYAGLKIEKNLYEKLNKITMTLQDSAAMIQYDEIRDEDGYLQKLVEKTQFAVTDENGETLVLSKEEYAQRYHIPEIVRLEGSLEDFLNSEQGREWKALLDRVRFANDAFTVVGVDRLDYVADFALKRAQITHGRDFTPGELESGQRVCLVQEALAQANGLQVGDTITLNLYGANNNLPYQYLGCGGISILDVSGYRSFEPEVLWEGAEYTIVGLYRCDSWPDFQNDPYAFSANTVFVPKSSVEVPMEENDSIVFNTLLLQNGKIDAFHQLAKNAGYAGYFKYYDYDYSTIAVNFHNYESLSLEMLTIGTVIYTVLLLLFLLLYPGSKKKDVGTMQSLGAGFLRRSFYVMASSMGIVLSASLLGGWIGSRLWEGMVKVLQASAESSIALQLEPGALLWVTLGQLIFASVLTVFVVLFVATPRKMASRR